MDPGKLALRFGGEVVGVPGCFTARDCAFSLDFAMSYYLSVDFEWAIVCPLDEHIYLVFACRLVVLGDLLAYVQLKQEFNHMSVAFQSHLEALVHHINEMRSGCKP